MGRFVFAPAVRGRGKNPLTSHAVSKALCCLGLPSAPSDAGSGTVRNHAFLCTLLADFIDKLGGLLHAFAAAPAVFLLESHLYRTE